MASVIIKLMTGDQLIMISVVLLESLSEKSMAGQGSQVEPRNSKQRFKENTKFRKHVIIRNQYHCCSKGDNQQTMKFYQMGRDARKPVFGVSDQV